MIKRSIALAAAALVLSMSPAAHAQQYPPTAAALTVSDTTVNPGQAVTVSGSGYANRARVTIIFESTPVELGTATTDDAGRFSTQVRIPSDATPGAHTIRATGLGPDGRPVIRSAGVTVLGATTSGGPVSRSGPAARSGGLARTGSDNSISLTQAGAVLILAGAGLVAVVRRRRASAHAEG